MQKTKQSVAIGIGHFTGLAIVFSYTKGSWSTPSYVKCKDLSIPLTASVLHYGQALFESIKAHYGVQGDILVFRPEDHWAQLCRGAARLVMPMISKDIFLQAVEKSVQKNRSLLSKDEHSALYIRTLLFNRTESGVPSVDEHFQLAIMVAPLRLNPTKRISAVIEQTYSRACVGSVGGIKMAGNYAAAEFANSLAHKKGSNTVLWTDAISRRYIEEFGTMNFFAVYKNGTVRTPPCGDTILPGITRESVISIAKYLGLSVSEKNLSVKNLMSGLCNGSIMEIFGTGTASTIMPVYQITLNDTCLHIADRGEESVALRIRKVLNAAYYGKCFPEWTHKIIL